jgi:hypothetical protein
MADGTQQDVPDDGPKDGIVTYLRERFQQ